jgi:orotate phosphoribosyltransferase
MEDRETQKEYLDILVRNEGFKFTDTFVPYTSGQIGPYYVQSAVVMNNGEDYRKACGGMASLIEGNIWFKDIDVISGGESRDWIFSLPVARQIKKPHAMIYKERDKILGYTDLKGKQVVHVADLNNEGSSPRDLWVPAIKKAGGTIEDIFFYVDRMEDGVQVMEDLGLKSHSLVKLDEYAWDYLLEKQVIDKEIYNSLRLRMENKDSWARNMLRSKKGIERFNELPPEKRAKISETYLLGQ